MATNDNHKQTQAHTRGPWTTYAVEGSCEVRQRLSFGTGKALLRMIPDDTPEWIANARLISAAPDLLEACRAALSGSFHSDDCPYDATKEYLVKHPRCVCGHARVREQFRAAIAKATGSEEVRP